MTLALNSRLSLSLTVDVLGGFNHMSVGEDVTVRADDETGPQRTGFVSRGCGGPKRRKNS